MERTAAADRFEGFGPDLVPFYLDLAAHNERDWWHANKERWAEHVGRPMQALAGELEKRYGRVKVFRPYRDVRFSNDKRPIQEHVSLAAAPDGPALYLQISADDVFMAGGYWRPERAHLEAFRRLCDTPARATEIHGLLEELDGSGFEMAEPTLVKAPKGYRSDHPEIDLLRRTSLTVGTHAEPGRWLSSRAALDHITAAWDTIGRWNRWLVDHLPPPSEPAVP